MDGGFTLCVSMQGREDTEEDFRKVVFPRILALGEITRGSGDLLSDLRTGFAEMVTLFGLLVHVEDTIRDAGDEGSPRFYGAATDV